MVESGSAEKGEIVQKSFLKQQKKEKLHTKKSKKKVAKKFN